MTTTKKHHPTSHSSDISRTSSLKTDANSIDADIDHYSELRGLKDPCVPLLEEWKSYLRLIRGEIHPDGGYNGEELIQWWEKDFLNNLYVLLSSAAVFFLTQEHFNRQTHIADNKFSAMSYFHAFQ